MDASRSFSDSYDQAREKFVAAATRGGAVVEKISLPERGPDGGALSTDIALFGPRTADRVLVTISGTHGIEGFAGSGAQIDWIERGEPARLPPGVAALQIHAINPYGFAWLRRVTQENVDLNRNWIDFTQTLPRNPGYEELADAICPADWSKDARSAADKTLLDYCARHGKVAWQMAISGGQYQHPSGMFFGGAGPTWSRRTQSQIFAEYLDNAAKVAIIDFHTGLGPWGLGERIVPGSRATREFERALRWYGIGVSSALDGTSTSAPISGDGLSASIRLLPHAEVTGVALEFGTVPVERVVEALRADSWLHANCEPESSQWREIKEQMRTAFYSDSSEWKGMIAIQALLACRQAIGGLSAAGELLR
jgi:hypothetical protein